MENTYFEIVPEELSVIIFSYVDNNYLITSLNYVNIEKVFQNKYNNLYIMINLLKKDKELNIYRYIKDENFWNILYSDMECLNYNKIIQILEGEKLVSLEIGDAIILIEKMTIDVIYTCLLYNKKIVYINVRSIKNLEMICENIGASLFDNFKIIYKYFNFDIISKCLYECFDFSNYDMIAEEDIHDLIIDGVGASYDLFLDYTKLFKEAPYMHAEKFINKIIIYILLFYSNYKKDKVVIYIKFVKRLIIMFNVFVNNKFYIKFINQTHYDIIALIKAELIQLK